MLHDVEMNVDSLRSILRDNRERHRSQFEEALAGWHARVTAELEDALADAKAGRKYRVAFNLPQPQDHTDGYDQAIEMLEYEEREILTLDRQTFVQLVMDDWGWKHDFLSTASLYTATANWERGAQGEDDI